MKATSMSVGNAVVDVTTKDEAPWKTLLADAGDRSVAMTVSGVCKDSVGENYVRDFAFDGAMANFQIVDQAGDTATGSFLVSKFEWTGNHNGAQEYSMSIESSGPVTFTPHA
jgi:TP901-1 family phage major tail protein